MKWYISGPITNATREQRDLFYLAEEMVKNLGYDVLNPMRHERPSEPLPNDERWVHYMKHSIRDLVDCDAQHLNMEMVTWQTFLADVLGRRSPKHM
jgi:hypothetical protein